MAKRYYKSKDEGSYDRMRHEVGKTVMQDWECPADTYAMTQKGNGSMDYLEVKNKIGREDARRIKRSELSGDADKY